ncbi:MULTISPECIES: hypothetical protein [Azospirillum]|jgi:hypothetical protein|uniref:DUF2730 family protein n=1 Tax=Azospirillum brasilense TaxID=192 RepID=A0ABU4PCG5_AZOBR|nr:MULTISPECIES: hypothetical protein [Azospirillum]MDW7552609.1 hypothetical protein [Azospirillum brasilense]MDW7592199.1 hypothetical protein [Azospirillum brasilense]MDW7627330.1 hypothetical protein [Azospirillum brasilense]MDX5954981.1 hypothetical protein [Azospirillum brasilense]
MTETLRLAFNDWFLGDLSSVVGLVISLFGFGITIIGIRKAKSAAKQAESAANQVKESIVKLNSLSDVSAAIAVIDEIRRLHKTGSWEIILDRYSALKRMLITVRHTHSKLSPENQGAVQNAIEKLSEMEANLERALEGGKKPGSVSKMNKVLSEHADKMHKILVELKSPVE